MVKCGGVYSGVNQSVTICQVCCGRSIYSCKIGGLFLIEYSICLGKVAEVCCTCRIVEHESIRDQVAEDHISCFCEASIEILQIKSLKPAAVVAPLSFKPKQISVILR